MEKGSFLGSYTYIYFRVTVEAAGLLPHLIDAPLHLLGLIDLWQFFFHGLSPVLLCSDWPGMRQARRPGK